MFNHRSGRIARVLLAGVTGVLLVAGCAQDTSQPRSPGASTEQATFNDADVTFASQMIPHHRQALEMADLAEGRAGAQVAALAGKIAAAQQPEIETMSGWLRSWAEPVPDQMTEHGGHAAHDGRSGHSGMAGMPGMMDMAEMAELRAASGKRFDRLFLELMIRHHEGAIEMAGVEQRQGAAPEATQLARMIATSQRTEVAQMQSMLGH